MLDLGLYTYKFIQYMFDIEFVLGSYKSIQYEGHLESNAHSSI